MNPFSLRGRPSTRRRLLSRLTSVWTCGTICRTLSPPRLTDTTPACEHWTYSVVKHSLLHVFLASCVSFLLWHSLVGNKMSIWLVKFCSADPKASLNRRQTWLTCGKGHCYLITGCLMLVNWLCLPSGTWHIIPLTPHREVLCHPITTPQTPQPFYSPFSGTTGWAGARRELLELMVQGKINRGRHTMIPTIRLGATPSGLVTIAHLLSPTITIPNPNPDIDLTSTLTLLNPTNSNRNSKAMKLTSFQQASPQHPLDDAVFMDALHPGLCWPSDCARPTDFPSFSAFAYTSGSWHVFCIWFPTCRHYLIN